MPPQLLVAKFVKFDKDKSGAVSKQELGALMKDTGFHLSDRGLLNLYRELDRTGDGLISLQEFVRWYSNMVNVS